MKFEIEKLEGHKKKVSVEVPPELVTNAFNRVLRSLQEEVELKGFRKGKVPVDLLKSQFQADTSKNVIRQLIEESLPVALQQNKLKPAENPNIEPGTLLDGFPFKYTATFEAVPEVELKDYTSFKAELKEIVVTDEEVNYSLDRLHSSLARFDDAAETQFTSNLCAEVEIWIADAPEKLSEAKSSKLVHEPGKGPLSPVMEEKIIGMNKGETREFSLDVPVTGDEKGEKKLFYYKVLLHGLKTKSLPPLDDEMAKRFGNFTGVQDLRQKISDEIKGQKDTAQKEEIKAKLLEDLLKRHTIDVPEAMKNRWMQTLVYNYATELGRMGMPQDKIEEKLKDESANFMTAAESQAKTSLLLGAIGEKEKIQANEEDFRQEIMRMAMEQGRNPGDLFKEIESKNLLGAILDRLEEVKTLDWLLGKATQAE
jgi:trigger factor